MRMQLQGGVPGLSCVFFAWNQTFFDAVTAVFIQMFELEHNLEHGSFLNPKLEGSCSLIGSQLPAKPCTASVEPRSSHVTILKLPYWKKLCLHLRSGNFEKQQNKKMAHTKQTARNQPGAKGVRPRPPGQPSARSNRLRREALNSVISSRKIQEK